MIVQAKLKLSVGDDDAACQSILGGFAVQRNGGVTHLRGKFGTDEFFRRFERNILVVRAHFRFGRGCENRLRQLLRALQSCRQRNTANALLLLIFPPAATLDIAAHNGFHRQCLETPHHDCSSGHLRSFAALHKALRHGACQMIRHDMLKFRKPKVCQLG